MAKSESRGKPPRRSGPESQVPDQAVGDKFARTFAPPQLYDPKKRSEWKLENETDGRGPYVIELNLQHIEGLPGAIAMLKALHDKFAKSAPAPTPISKTYYRCLLN